MTTVELLAYCQARKPQPLAPDLIWQREAHSVENLRRLYDDDDPTPPGGFHDMYAIILETRGWLETLNRTYATVLFSNSKQQIYTQELTHD